jgi:hypothetical protein
VPHVPQLTNLSVIPARIPPSSSSKKLVNVYPGRNVLQDTLAHLKLLNQAERGAKSVKMDVTSVLMIRESAPSVRKDMSLTEPV